jgi:hypothetical protein
VLTLVLASGHKGTLLYFRAALRPAVTYVHGPIGSHRNTMTAGGIAVSAFGSLSSRFRRLEWISLAFALVWGTGLVIAALLVPVYQSSSVSSSGAVTDGSATLV